MADAHPLRGCAARHAGSSPAPGTTIKNLRNKLGLTQDDLVKRAYIKYTTLMKVEGGAVNKPSVQTVSKIAKGLDVSIDDLMK